MSRDDMITRLTDVLLPDRMAHTLAVEETCRQLAQRFGCDIPSATLAGLLHDCAKGMPRGDLIWMAERNPWPCDALEIKSTALLHAPAGAYLARREYGVNDERVLSAIRFHTTGRAGMSLPEAIVYLADAIEPTRAEHPGLAAIRAAAQTDLRRATMLAVHDTISYVQSRGRTVHPRSQQAFEWLRTANTWTNAPISPQNHKTQEGSYE